MLTNKISEEKKMCDVYGLVVSVTVTVFRNANKDANPLDDALIHYKSYLTVVSGNFRP